MPLSDERLDQLTSNRYLTILDFFTVCHQIEECKQLTSFVAVIGQYEFNKVPFLK